MAKARKKRGRRPYRRAVNGYFRSLIAANAVAATKDESYTLVQKIVDELLRDPAVAKKIEYHTRQIFKTLAEKM